MLMLMPMLMMLALTMMLLLDAFDAAAFLPLLMMLTPMQKCRMMLAILLVLVL